MSSAACPPRHTTASFSYLHWKPEYRHIKPYELLYSPTGPDREQLPVTNIAFSLGEPEPVHDVRGTERLYGLDSHGFAFRTGPESSFSAFYDRERVESEYLPEVVEPWMKKTVEGADRVIVFDWHLRRNDASRLPTFQDLNDGSQPYMPAYNVHVDQSAQGAVRRVRGAVPGEADELLRGRVRIINFWKPLFNPVLDVPLAVCDGTTVDPHNLVTMDYVRRDYVGESYLVLPHTALRWHYLSRQGPNEVTLIKVFDSDRNVKAKYCPHASFTLSDIPPDAAPRESIEIRTLVFSGHVGSFES